MAQTNFRAQDFKHGGAQVVGSTRDRKPAQAKTQDKPEPTTQPVVDPKNPDAVPVGTIPEVLTWVGDDKKKAQKALDAENENEKPRKGLVEELEAKLADENDEETSDESDDSDEDAE